MTQTCPLAIDEAASSLTKEIEVRELSDFAEGAFGDWSYNQVLASLRHEYTNYDDLLSDLPACPVDCEGYDDAGGECMTRIIAHDILKWAAKDAVEEAYWQVPDRRKGKGGESKNTQEVAE